MTTHAIVEVVRFKISREVWKYSQSRRVVAFIEGIYKHSVLKSNDAKVYNGSQYYIPYSENLRKIRLNFFFIDDLLTMDIGSSIYYLENDKLFKTDGNITSVNLDIYANGSSLPIGKVSINISIQDMYEENIAHRNINEKPTIDHQFAIPGFYFKRLSRVLHWERLGSLNLERLIQENDVATLLTLLDDVTTGDISQEDVDPKLYKAVQLAQYVSQYLISCRKVMKDRESILLKALDSFEEEEEALDLKLTKLRAREKALLRESKELDGITTEYTSALKVLNPKLVSRLYHTYQDKLHIAKDPNYYQKKYSTKYDLDRMTGEDTDDENNENILQGHLQNNRNINHKMFKIDRSKPGSNHNEKKSQFTMDDHREEEYAPNDSPPTLNPMSTMSTMAGDGGVRPRKRSNTNDSWAKSGPPVKQVFEDPNIASHNNNNNTNTTNTTANEAGDGDDEEIDPINIVKPNPAPLLRTLQTRTISVNAISTDTNTTAIVEQYDDKVLSNVEVTKTSISNDNIVPTIVPTADFELRNYFTHSVSWNEHSDLEYIPQNVSATSMENSNTILIPIDITQSLLKSSESTTSQVINKPILPNIQYLASNIQSLASNMHILQASSVVSSTAISMDSLTPIITTTTNDLPITSKITNTPSVNPLPYIPNEPIIKKSQVLSVPEEEVIPSIDMTITPSPAAYIDSSDSLFDNYQHTEGDSDMNALLSPDHCTRKTFMDDFKNNIQGVDQPLSATLKSFESINSIQSNTMIPKRVIESKDIVVSQSDMVFRDSIEDYYEEDEEDPYNMSYNNQTHQQQYQQKNYSNFSNIENDTSMIDNNIDTSKSISIDFMLPSESLKSELKIMKNSIDMMNNSNDIIHKRPSIETLDIITSSNNTTDRNVPASNISLSLNIKDKTGVIAPGISKSKQYSNMNFATTLSNEIQEDLRKSALQDTIIDNNNNTPSIPSNTNTDRYQKNRYDDIDNEIDNDEEYDNYEEDNNDSLLFSPMNNYQSTNSKYNANNRNNKNNFAFNDSEEDNVLLGTQEYSATSQLLLSTALLGGNNSTTIGTETGLGNTFQLISPNQLVSPNDSPDDSITTKIALQLGGTNGTTTSVSLMDKDSLADRSSYSVTGTNTTREQQVFSPLLETSSIDNIQNNNTEDEESIPPPTYESIVNSTVEPIPPSLHNPSQYTQQAESLQEQSSIQIETLDDSSNLFIESTSLSNDEDIKHHHQETKQSQPQVQQSQIQQVNKIHREESLSWVSNKADMEDMELARAIEVYVSTIKLDTIITEAITRPEIRISLEFLGVKSQMSNIVKLGDSDTLQPVSYCTHLKFNTKQQEQLLVQEIIDVDDALAMQLHVYDATFGNILGTAIIELWVMIEDSVNILRQEIEILNSDSSDFIGYVLIDVKGFRLLKKCANYSRSSRK